MVIGVLVCGILAYAIFDVVWTFARRRKARAAAAALAAAAAAAEARAVAAWADELETVESILWTEADQRWLESRRISLPT
ncbi:hypothetical protein [Actinomadura algeriensis]|uniref:Type II secretory pathway pseudopilin PulG n=1 Tax=Actinomadura algeriensis TaxID=1679523 RepID=A0ABR9JVB6_9ACTN|nr:hypothetical protein [Actinomadura algeriensis]MBE1534514.1 type II secretory pathway pseudopilin PulG [Actinomadura algeriensis]